MLSSAKRRLARRLALTAITTASALGLLAPAAQADRIPVTWIWLVGADDGLLSKPRATLLSADPAWSPDGGTLAFAKADVAVVNPDGSGFKRLTRTPDVDETDPAWSPDGSRLAFRSEGGGPSGLYVMNADGSDRRRIARNVRGGEGSSISWSPDGSSILFVTPPDSTPRIATIAPDGSNLRKLTPRLRVDKIDGPGPHWSPDGTQIVFHAAPRSSSAYQIYAMNSDGSERRVLTTGGGNKDAAWSPDGKSLAFAGAREADEEPNGLYTLRLDGSDPVAVAGGPAALHLPVWSPDGSRIAYLRGESERVTARVIRPDGTGSRRLVRGGVWHDAPAWSPDGTRIALTRLFLSSVGTSDAISKPCGSVTIRMTPSAYRIRAHRLPCRKARSVTRNWLYAVQSGEETRRVDGFSCRRDRRRGRVRCASGERVVRFHWRPARLDPQQR